MNTEKRKGFFITIEGVEGVGKSSAIAFLTNFFQSRDFNFVATREPGGTEIAEDIRQLILQSHKETMFPDTELLLMFAGRAQHIATIIEPALNEDKIVISDRFTDATYAYQGGGRGIETHRIEALEKLVQKGLQPNLTLLLDASIEVTLQRIFKRGAKDRIEQEDVEFFDRVRTTYLRRAQEFPERFRVIDASRSKEEVQQAIAEVILRQLDLTCI